MVTVLFIDYPKLNATDLLPRLERITALKQRQLSQGNIHWETTITDPALLKRICLDFGIRTLLTVEVDELPATSRVILVEVGNAKKSMRTCKMFYHTVLKKHRSFLV